MLATYLSKNSFLILLFILCVFCQVSHANHQKDTVTVALNSSATIRSAFLPLFKDFEAQTNIRVKIVRYSDDNEFDANMERWLVQGIDTPDVLYGHNSQRLLSMAAKGLVYPITELWNKNAWQEKFRPELIDWVSHKDEIYALPYGYYTWGLFFKRSLTERFGPVPTTWQAFIEYCQKLKQAGISPFPSSDKQPWIAAAWFEYLVLRMHGLKLFEQIVAGEVSFHDQQLQSVFIKWQQMIKLGLFSSEFSQYRWEEYLPHFLRGELGFILMSTNLGSRIFDKQTIEAVDFMAFPKISDIPRYETGPANVFFIAKNCPNKSNAEKLLTFFAQAQVQSQLAQYLYASPARSDGTILGGKYTAAGHKTLTEAKGISPFFDRAAKPEFEKIAVVAFADFIKNGDINALTQTLELARLQVYSDKKSQRPQQ